MYKTTALIIAFLCLNSQAAGILKTIPWNGHSGAISFTFDDACASQVTNVFPALQSRDIHATFFIPGSWNFNQDPQPWIQAAQAGNEIANHTVSHLDLTILDSTVIVDEIVKKADSLRALDPSINANTLAYPYCATNALVNKIADTQNIIARTCGGSGQFSWTQKPSNWMQMSSYIVTDAATSAAALTSIDQVASNNRWLVTLHHGISGDGSEVTTTQLNELFDRAITNKLWIAPYRDIAAYWRASFTMDTVTATVIDGTWTLHWESPHPRMPAKIPLRIRIDNTILGSSVYVYQNQQSLTAESDGSYIIDFMALNLKLSSSPIASEPVLEIAPETTRFHYNHPLTSSHFDLAGRKINSNDSKRK